MFNWLEKLFSMIFAPCAFLAIFFWSMGSMFTETAWFLTPIAQAMSTLYFVGIVVFAVQFYRHGNW
jgi:hypothetical protein